MFIEAKFKMHIHNSKLRSLLSQHDFEGRALGVCSRLELSEESLLVAEDVLGADES